jgi:hypothetical protein
VLVVGGGELGRRVKKEERTDVDELFFVGPP